MRKLSWVLPLTVILVLAANFAVKTSGVVAGAIDLSYPLLATANVAVSSIVPPIVAAGLYLLLGRLTRRPVRNFQILASAVFLVSLLGPVGALAGTVPEAPAAPPSTAAFMVAMHVVDWLLVVLLFTRLASTPTTE